MRRPPVTMSNFGQRVGIRLRDGRVLPFHLVPATGHWSGEPNVVLGRVSRPTDNEGRSWPMEAPRIIPETRNEEDESPRISAREKVVQAHVPFLTPSAIAPAIKPVDLSPVSPKENMITLLGQCVGNVESLFLAADLCTYAVRGKHGSMLSIIIPAI